MVYFKLFLFLFVYIKTVSLQGSGSGNNGNLRLCVVEGRGAYRRAGKFCPVLDQSESGVECVVGRDRLDCLRRMSKGVVDFGVFSPEDLIATQWANIDVLVTDELREKPRKFATSIVAVISRSLLPELDTTSSAPAVLRGSTLCHLGLGADDRRPLSDTLTEYLTTLVTVRSCNASMSMEENRIKAMADFFKGACRAGPWVLDAARDSQLKAKYPSLCAACSGPCSRNDRYWGPAGALACLAEGAGSAAWAEADSAARYFGEQNTTAYANPEDFAYLCRDGSWQAIRGNAEPCAWLQRPWPLIVAKTKAAAAVSQLVGGLNSSAVVGAGWRGALAALLEARAARAEPRPPAAPLDYLARAPGFREAYSQAGCTPTRHITMCTSSALAHNKCEWMSEAGAVYGVEPPLQCVRGEGAEGAEGGEACLEAVANGSCDVTVGDGDSLVKAMRDASLTPILHETTNILNQSTTVVAYVREDSAISKMADLRGKRAAFPRFDGFAWHSVLRYLAKTEETTCKNIMDDFFGSVCAPGVEKHGLSADLTKKWTENCYVEEGKVLDGELQALRSLVEGKSDVAFLSMYTYNQYIAHLITEPLVQDVKIKPICAEESQKYCFISWSNIGHVYVKNTTAMRAQEIVNVFTKLDQLFGKHFPFHTAMFSLYGPYNHQSNVIFNDNTKMLATSDILRTHPYDKFPLNFERSLEGSVNRCYLSDLTGFGVAMNPSVSVLIVTLVCAFFS